MKEVREDIISSFSLSDLLADVEMSITLVLRFCIMVLMHVSHMC
jgi:hypothetical protein